MFPCLYVFKPLHTLDVNPYLDVRPSQQEENHAGFPGATEAVDIRKEAVITISLDQHNSSLHSKDFLFCFVCFSRKDFSL